MGLGMCILNKHPGGSDYALRYADLVTTQRLQFTYGLFVCFKLGYSLHTSVFKDESTEYKHVSKLTPEVPTVVITFLFVESEYKASIREIHFF